MPSCLCCSQTLVRCIQGHRFYWFCTYCHQEMLCADDVKGDAHLPRHIAKRFHNKKSFEVLRE